jgi:O-antigen/teichoic acid export membrane protein
MSDPAATMRAPAGKAEWALAIGVQCIGAVASFVITMSIAALQGPAAQGAYGLVRTGADLIVALGLFGLPQGMVHLINRMDVRPALLDGWLMRYSAALLGLVLVVGALAYAGIGQALVPRWLESPLSVLAMGIGCLGWVAQGLQRIFVLCRGSSLRFAWLTAFPAMALLVGVFAQIGVGSHRYEWAVAFSGVASVLFGEWQMRHLRRDPRWRQGATAPARKLVTSGTQGFAQVMSMALQPYLSLVLMQWWGASLDEIGWFVFAGSVFQAFALPAGYASPMIFARLSEAKASGTNRAVVRTMWMVGGATLVAGVVAALALHRLVPFAFGPSYRNAGLTCAIIALAGPAILMSRLGTAVLLGLGRYALCSGLAMVRIVATPLCMIAAWTTLPLDRSSGAAAGWLLAEVVYCVVMWVFGARPPSAAEVRVAKASLSTDEAAVEPVAADVTAPGVFTSAFHADDIRSDRADAPAVGPLATPRMPNP